MQTFYTYQRAGRLEVKTLRLPLHRSFAKPSKRTTVKHPAYHIQLPQRLWDRIVLFMFICCLFTFLHAFGVADHDLNASANHTFRTPPFISPRRWNAVEIKRILARGGARVMVDWHGNYELLPSTSSDPISAATITQAFLGQTPTSFRSEHRNAGEGSHSMDIRAETSFTFRGKLYHAFQPGSEGIDEGGGDHGRFSATGQAGTASPRTRKRRFGRCLPEEVCL